MDQHLPPRCPLSAVVIALALSLATACQAPGSPRAGLCRPSRPPYRVARPPLGPAPPRTPIILGNYAGYNYPLNPRLVRRPRLAPAVVDPAASFDEAR